MIVLEKEGMTMTNKKELFLKWTKNLFFVQLVLLICAVLSAIPMIGTVFQWISSILSLIIVYVLYQLAPVSERYKKAAIFTGISVIAGFLTKTDNFALLGLVISICSLVGLYQEYCGHSDMLDGIDNTLAKKWHSLFNWQIFGGIVLGVLAAPLVAVLAALLLFDANILTVLVLFLVTGFDTILRLVYLSYLKRTREQYEAFPENMDGGQSVDYI